MVQTSVIEGQKLHWQDKAEYEVTRQENKRKAKENGSCEGRHSGTMFERG